MGDHMWRRHRGVSMMRSSVRLDLVLGAADGVAIQQIAAELGVAVMTVKLWRRRYAEAGLAGLADAPRPGHPPTYMALGISGPRELNLGERTGERSKDLFRIVVWATDNDVLNRAARRQSQGRRGELQLLAAIPARQVSIVDQGDKRR
jgi:hypothetical protein